MLLGAALCAGLTACTAPPPIASPAFVHGPYKDLTLSMDPRTHRIATANDGRPQPVVDMLPPGAALTWAFAVGECGAETLGGLDAQPIADANLPAFARAGVRYIVSTGGEGGLFTCGSDAGMEAFIARYASPQLLGIDFDIEAKQTPAIVEAIVRRVAVAQRRHPSLRFSFTLPTLAASDGSGAGLNAQGRAVLQTIREQGLNAYTINLMAMDYGPPAASNCVVASVGGRDVCDMGRSAVQAAENLHARHGVPFAQIELTPMIGVNDVAANEFAPGDVEVIARYARQRGLAGVHYWSLDRDRPCPDAATGVSAVCHGAPTVVVGAFGRAFAATGR